MSDGRDGNAKPETTDVAGTYGSSAEAHYAAQTLVHQMLHDGHEPCLIAAGLMEMAARCVYAAGLGEGAFLDLAKFAYRVGSHLEKDYAQRRPPSDPTLN